MKEFELIGLLPPIIIFAFIILVIFACLVWILEDYWKWGCRGFKGKDKK